ncbi:MAG: FAD binding domain-containing protein [Nitrososphaerota archaeon]|nr:FAD binding domain-containing protein [Nitrososphaerota archaeon]
MFELPDFEYFEPQTLEEALHVLREYGPKAKILGGGTDLLGLMKDRISGSQMPIPQALVNIKKIRELGIVAHNSKESTIGSTVTLSEITSDAELGLRFPAFVQAAGLVATTQIRNMGTLGGNLCQRPWCWYFRHPAFDCFKKGGKQCYAITGDNSTYFSVYNLGTCVMSHPSDTAPALIALGAKASIASASYGVKEVALSDFFLGPKNVQDNILLPDEVLVSVSVPRSSSKQRSIYLKQRIRENWDFALASIAACGSLDDQGRIDSVRIVLGGVAPMPFALETSGILNGKRLNETAKQEMATLVSTKAKPLRMNRYKVRIVRALVLRALDAIFSA